MHVGIVSVDTSIYEMKYRGGICSFVPNPFTAVTSILNTTNFGMAVDAFVKKNSNQVDFYSISGKIGTSVIPIMLDSYKNLYKILFT